MAGCETPTISAGHALGGAETDPELTFHPDHLMGPLRATAFEVPEGPVHGYVIYDQTNVEVSNWTTLDVAVERAAKG